tara:strand:- start:1736 stop:2668 length:933 start_codon:yes stop_codon:yes gene_type:complete
MKFGGLNIADIKHGGLPIEKVMHGSNLVWEKYVYLLDLYVGAAVGFSFIKLRAAYSGSCVRVRRSSDNTELDIGFNSIFFDSDALAAFCGASDGFVVKLYDQSLNGNDLEQTTAALQPKIYDSLTGIVLINGLPGFFHNESYLENATKTAASTSTIFITGNIDTSDTTNASYVGYPAAGTSKYLGLYFWGSVVDKYFGFNTWNGDSYGYGGADSDVGSQSIITALVKDGDPNTSGVKLFHNGTEKTLSQVRSTSVSRNAIDGLYLGRGGAVTGNQELVGYVQELLIWDNDLTGADRLIIEANINNRFSIF